MHRLSVFEAIKKRRLPLIRNGFIGKSLASLRYILLFVALKNSGS